MVVQGHIPHQRLPHVLGAVETVGLENIRNAAIKTFHHAIGLWRSRLGQSVLYVQRLAKSIKLMFPAGLPLPTGKQAVREFLAVVGQQLLNSDRASLVQCLQEAACTASRLVRFDLHIHPARGAINGHEQVVPPRAAGRQAAKNRLGEHPPIC